MLVTKNITYLRTSFIYIVTTSMVFQIKNMNNKPTVVHATANSEDVGSGDAGRYFSKLFWQVLQKTSEGIS